MRTLSSCTLAGALCALLSSACATSTTSLLVGLDAVTDAERQDAIEDATEALDDSEEDLAVRATAAMVLGRLRAKDPDAIRALGAGLLNEHSSRLRSWSAWALGELRSEASFSLLVRALRTPLDSEVAQQVLEGLAKHSAHFHTSPDGAIELVEAMVFYAGNTESPPAIYDLIDGKTRTLEVNISVAERALATALANGDPKARAALFEATSELLRRLHSERRALVQDPKRWRTLTEEAVSLSQRTLEIDDPRQRRLVVYSLGRFGDELELGPLASAALISAEGKLPDWLASPELRLVATWSLANLARHTITAHRALNTEIFTKTWDPRVLRLVSDLSLDPEDPDLLQRMLGVTDAR